jgi:hypothetical protein
MYVVRTASHHPSNGRVAHLFPHSVLEKGGGGGGSIPKKEEATRLAKKAKWPGALGPHERRGSPAHATTPKH